jgi:hypothetical protein
MREQAHGSGVDDGAAEREGSTWLGEAQVEAED